MPFAVSDKLWEVASKYMPPILYKGSGSEGGRPNVDLRSVFTGIVYWMKSGCQVGLIPTEFGSPSTIKRYFYRWVKLGVFDSIYYESLKLYDEEIGINWKWQSIDGAQKKSPYCTEHSGPNPTDRAKPGTKISILTDKNGIPISIVVAPANRHDSQFVEENFTAILLIRPNPKEIIQNLCGDKAYDAESIRSTVKEWGYIPHIKTRGEEIELKSKRRYKPKRWVVERTHAWLNGFRGIFTRWLRSIEGYAAFIALAASSLIVNKLK